jgi:hypothetical protein
MVVGFDEEPGLALDDILSYVGFDPHAAGKNLWGRIETYKVDTEVKDVVIRIVKYLDDHIESEYLSVVFVNPAPMERKDDELFMKKRVNQVSGVITELIRRLGLTPFNTYEQYDVEGLSATVFKDAAAALDEELIRGNRKQLAAINTPNPDGDGNGSET